MANAVTTDTRTHTLGDLHMVTGTFTDGGKEVDYSNHLSTVLAAGGHMTSLISTDIDVNNGNILSLPSSLVLQIIAYHLWV